MSKNHSFTFAVTTAVSDDSAPRGFRRESEEIEISAKSLFVAFKEVSKMSNDCASVETVHSARRNGGKWHLLA